MSELLPELESDEPSLDAELRELREELGRVDPKQLTDGSWFHQNLHKTAARFLEKQRRRCAVEPWRERYPALDDTQLGDRIVGRACRRAAVLGGSAGAAITGISLGSVATGGMAAGGAFIVALAEMALLERMQVNMVFTLAELHRYPLRHERLNDVGDLYAQVLKVKGASRLARYGRDAALTLFKTIGVKFVQRAVLKYAMPVLSVGIGGGMNFLMTRSLGKHSQRRFQRTLTATERLESLHRQDDAHHALLLSLMMRMAAASGRVDKRKKALLRRTLDSMVEVGHDRQTLVAALDTPEETLLANLEAVQDADFYEVMMELLMLMAVTDARLDDAELALLHRVSDRCGVELDETDLRMRYAEFLGGKV